MLKGVLRVVDLKQIEKNGRTFFIATLGNMSAFKKFSAFVSSEVMQDFVKVGSDLIVDLGIEQNGKFTNISVNSFNIVKA